MLLSTQTPKWWAKVLTSYFFDFSTLSEGEKKKKKPGYNDVFLSWYQASGECGYDVHLH